MKRTTNGQPGDEISLHDEWANTIDLSKIDVLEVMEGVNAVENRYLTGRVIDTFGSWRELNVLDLGPGLGESSVYFALQGAKVVSMDLSPGMSSLCMKLAELHGVADRITTITGSANELIETGRVYDVVYAANLLHHLPCPESLLKKAANVLKTRGLFLSYDPLPSNPVVRLYRRLARQVRTSEECPLPISFTGVVQRHFANVEHREFWFLAQSLFVKYFLWNHIHPSRTRYWKLMHEPKWSCANMMRRLHLIDRHVASLPLIKHWAWNMAIVGRKKHEVEENK